MAAKIAKMLIKTNVSTDQYYDTHKHIMGKLNQSVQLENYVRETYA